MSFYFLSYQM